MCTKFPLKKKNTQEETQRKNTRTRILLSQSTNAPRIKLSDKEREREIYAAAFFQNTTRRKRKKKNELRKSSKLEFKNLPQRASCIYV